MPDRRLRVVAGPSTEPGISVLLDTTPQAAAQQMRDTFPRATRLHEAAQTVGVSSVDRVREAGFDVIADPTRKFPNHGRLVHPEGEAGFTEANLTALSAAFDTAGGLTQ